jgi:hypothetical protein
MIAWSCIKVLAEIEIAINFTTLRDVSSVGSEHYFDRVGVTGSSPVRPTATVFVRHTECECYKTDNLLV